MSDATTTKRDSETPSSLDSLLGRLRPAHVGIRPELEVSRHVFRDVPAYVLRDPVSFKSHKLSPRDYQIYVSLSSENSLGSIFTQLCERKILVASQEESFYRFVLSLAQMGLLSLPVSDGSSLYTKYKRRRDAERRAKWLGILFLQVPLFQPDRFLERTKRLFEPLFTRWAFVVWLLGLVASSSILLAKWNDFRNPLGTMLTLHNVPMLWALLVGLKIVHEFGHAYACKRFGGCVPEMGAYFIIFTPCAYIDASASWGFPRALHRIIVGLGGMYFESIAAQLAVLVWALTSQGPVHSAAHYAIILATVVTTGFNANPLMKYDGYYILSDLVGIPNLRQEAQQRANAFASRWIFGKQVDLPVLSRGCHIFLVAFGLTCAVYKVAVVAGLTVAIAWKLPTVGILVAVLYLGNTLKQIVSFYIRSMTRLPSRSAKIRAAAGAMTCAIVTTVVLTLIPMPNSEQAQGVIRRQHESILHAPSSGWLVSALANEGDAIRRGQAMYQLDNPRLVADQQQNQLELQQLRTELFGNLQAEPAAISSLQTRHNSKLQDLAVNKTRVQDLTITASQNGTLVQSYLRRQVGHFVQEGDPIAYLAGGNWVVKSLVTSEQLARLKTSLHSHIDVLFPAMPEHRFQAEVTRITQVGSKQVDSLALTQVGGGDIAISQTNGEAEQVYFEITLLLPHCEALDFVRHGMTANVRLESLPTTLGRLIYRRVLNLWDHLRRRG